jgi:protoporphyrinogen/coproporphyrinogen III oxidase
VKLSTPVAELVKGAERTWRIVGAQGDAAEFDGAVLATPAPQTARLIERIDPQLAHVAGRIEYASSVVVVLVYPAANLPRGLDSFGAVTPRIERRNSIALSFPSVKFPGRGPAELVPIRVFMGGVLRPELPAKPDAELVALAHGEVAALLGATGPPIETHVARWLGSMPQYHVGHLEVVGALEHMAATHPGLALAGSAYRGVGIPQCVHSGRVAAERVVEQMHALAVI